MSVNLESVLKNIQSEKNTKLVPANIRKGITALGVQGTLQPVTVQGGDVGLAIYLQDETPINPEGIWMNTDKTYDDIYIETEMHATQHSYMFSNQITDDDSNLIKNRTVPADFNLCTYCQRGNKFHFFGYWNFSVNNSSTTATLQHYSYNFDTNTWTKHSDCPIPQGGGAAEWVDDNTIYIIGNRHTNYYQYMYKYTINTDTWEQLDDISISGYVSGQVIDSCYDNDNQRIYFTCSQSIFVYDIANHSISFVCNSKHYYRSNWTIETCTNSSARLGIQLYNNCLYYNSYIMNTGYSSCPGYYNLLTGAYIRWSKSYSFRYSGYDAWGNGQLYIVGNRIYSIQTMAINDKGTDGFIYQALPGSTSATATKVTSDSSYSSLSLYANYPVGIINVDGVDLMLNFYGTNASSMKAVRLYDKDYNFENDTLLIYGNNNGVYETQMYLNSKVINGQRWCQRFNNVYLWDAENQTMLKTLPLAYGNGTDWTTIR